MGHHVSYIELNQIASLNSTSSHGDIQYMNESLMISGT